MSVDDAKLWLPIEQIEDRIEGLLHISSLTAHHRNRYFGALPLLEVSGLRDRDVKVLGDPILDASQDESFLLERL